MSKLVSHPNFRTAGPTIVKWKTFSKTPKLRDKCMTVRLDLGGLTDSHLSLTFRFFKLLPMIITKKKAEQNPSQKFNIFWEKNYPVTQSFFAHV